MTTRVIDESSPRVIVISNPDWRRFDPVMQAWKAVNAPLHREDLLIDAVDEKTGETLKIHIKNQRNGESWLGGFVE